MGSNYTTHAKTSAAIHAFLLHFSERSFKSLLCFFFWPNGAAGAMQSCVDSEASTCSTDFMNEEENLKAEMKSSRGSRLRGCS